MFTRAENSTKKQILNKFPSKSSLKGYIKESRARPTLLYLISAKVINFVNE